jgi:prepilin-type N-terminal cleavage/methylation domain-containing protein/prepilin-type processing-associated H-X9-DG protein
VRIRKAFTLIELLVVISIIALLMGILMPALMRARDHGRRILCGNNVRGLGTANVLYAEEEDGWYVPSMDRTWGAAKYWPANQFFRKLVGYKSKQAPSENNDYAAPKEFLCPSDTVSVKQRPDPRSNCWLSYGYNVTDWYYGTDWFGITYAGHKTTTVPTPASEMVLTESNDWWLHWKGANYKVGWDVLHQDTIMPYKDAGCDGPTLYRHSDGANFAFYDGHVEYMKKDKAFNQEMWDAGSPGMWSIFRQWPPTPEEQSRLEKPPTRPIRRP